MPHKNKAARTGSAAGHRISPRSPEQDTTRGPGPVPSVPTEQAVALSQYRTDAAARRLRHSPSTSCLPLASHCTRSAGSPARAAPPCGCSLGPPGPLDLLAESFRESKPDPLEPYLHQRWNNGITDATALHAELQERGFTGSVRDFRRYVPVPARHRRARSRPGGPEGQADHQLAGCVACAHPRVRKEDDRTARRTYGTR